MYLDNERNDMDEKQKELKEFLEKQIEWTKEKDGILGKIDEIFHQMEIIAKYKAEHNLLD